MVSHIADHAANVSGIQHLARHVNSGGKLMLGIQGPHHDYEKSVSNGMLYSQKIEPAEHGFVKHYYLAEDTHVVMSQTINYRTYTWSEALALLSAHGFEHDAQAEKSSHFIAFRKV